MITLMHAMKSAACAMMLLSGPALAAGAIAVDDGVGVSPDQIHFSYVTGADNKQEAERDALLECRKQGNTNCNIAVSFDRCGAYAASKLHSGIGYGHSKDMALRQALDDCDSNHCRIVAVECEE